MRTVRRSYPGNLSFDVVVMAVLLADGSTHTPLMWLDPGNHSTRLGFVYFQDTFNGLANTLSVAPDCSHFDVPEFQFVDPEVE